MPVPRRLVLRPHVPLRVHIHPRLMLRARRRRANRMRARAENFVQAYETSDDLGARIVRMAERYRVEFLFDIGLMRYVVLVPSRLVLAQERVPNSVLRLISRYRMHVIMHLEGHPLQFRRYPRIRNTPPEYAL